MVFKPICSIFPICSKHVLAFFNYTFRWWHLGPVKTMGFRSVGTGARPQRSSREIRTGRPVMLGDPVIWVSRRQRRNIYSLSTKFYIYLYTLILPKKGMDQNQNKCWSFCFFWTARCFVDRTSVGHGTGQRSGVLAWSFTSWPAFSGRSKDAVPWVQKKIPSGRWGEKTTVRCWKKSFI